METCTETPAKNLQPGDTILLPVMTCEHVIVVGPLWAPKEVWLSDAAGHVHTLSGDAAVTLLERSRP